MRLSELKTGQTGVIVKILGHGAFRKRVMEMGFVRGRRVNVVLQAPLRDPIIYEVMGYEVGLRRAEANLIEVTSPGDDDETQTETASHTNTASHSELPERRGEGTESDTEPRRTINAVLIGNPNCGKTSLFNAVTGGRERVGNYSGVTVDAKHGRFRFKGYTINLVDLPGTYSLASYSPEELYVRQYLREETPDVIINVVDASNLERNLYLTTELIDMDRSMVIALNMFDEMRADGTVLNHALLGRMIGVPITPTVSKTGEGVNSLFDTVVAVFEGSHEVVRHVHVHLNPEVEQALGAVKDAVKANGEIGHSESPRHIAIKLLEGDAETERYVASAKGGTEILRTRDLKVAAVERSLGGDISEIIAAEKYGFISGALAETMVRGNSGGASSTDVIDQLVTNKLFGFPLFFLVMFCMFWLTFSLGQYPMDWIEQGVGWLSRLADGALPAGPLRDLIVDGIIGGVGGVIVFLPNILILYFCISFMEDSGYMARAAFIMDKVMHRVGLHGKSFIPLVMGFGCNVPAIMASRTIESRSSRLITIMINPFMSCSARLPVYVLFTGTFFPDHAAWVFMGLYVAGILVAVVTARMLRKFFFKKDETPFVMELPPYRLPTLRASMRHMWNKGEQYLRKMGGIILFASVIVWALNYFPRHDENEQAGTETAVVAASDSDINTQTDSFLEMAGKLINPVMEPLGFHWRATVAALAGVPAKEIVVSTLGVLYTGDETVDEHSQALGARLMAVNPATGKPDFTGSAALAFMVFILLYCPCMATVTAIVKETHSWKYGAFAVVWNTVVAWAAALAVYRVALLFV